MATGQEILDAIALADSNKTVAATNLKMVNFAIDSSWPWYRLNEQAQGGTFAASTYTYSLSALTLIDRDLGIASLTVVPTNGAPIDISHRTRQYYDNSSAAWTLVVSPDIINKYANYPFYVEYQYRQPRITALSETVNLPIDVAADAAMLWTTMYGATQQNVDSAFWKAFAAEKLRVQALWQSRCQWLPMKVTRGRGHI